MSDEELFPFPFPTESFRCDRNEPAPLRMEQLRQFNPAAHTFWADGETEEPPDAAPSSAGGSSAGITEVMLKRAESARVMQDGRGHHTERGTQLGYAQTAYEHLEMVESFTLGRPCRHSCAFDRNCGLNITPAHLMRAHIRIYGTKTTKVLHVGKPPTYDCVVPFTEVKERRKQVVLSAFSRSPLDPQQQLERFMVADVGPVCPEYCRAAHGIPIGSWNKLLALARSGQLQAGMEWDTACEEMDSAALHDSRSEAAAKEETIEWWVLWLTLEDQTAVSESVGGAADATPSKKECSMASHVISSYATAT